MLGTFSFEPMLKVISALQFGPWKFQKLQTGPFFHLQPACLPLCSLSPPAKRCCCRRSGPSPGHLLRSSQPLLSLALCPPRLATQQQTTAGRHLAAAVDGLLQHPRALSFARTSTTRTPAKPFPSFFCHFPNPRP